MKKGQTSKRGGIQDILCPFTDMVITQGSGYADGNFSHKGTRAIDVRGKEAGVCHGTATIIYLKTDAFGGTFGIWWR